jgi:twinkle protein
VKIQETPKIALKAEHLELLESRGLDPELITKLGWQSLDRNDSDWIAIPFVAGGEVVNWKYRTISGEKRFCQDAGARKVFWNVDVLFDDTLKDQPLIITDGERDAVIAMQCGFQRVLSVPDGAPAQEIGADTSSIKYSYLDDAGPMLEGVSEIILATDGDGPGINLMNDLSLRLGKDRCKWVKYPKGCKDLNEAWARYGAKGVQQTIQRAQWCKVDGVYRMGELPPVAERRAFETGMDILRGHYRVRTRDFCVITGIPSHGKSSLINDIACNMVVNHGWNACFASFEQQPQVDHRRNLRTWFNGKHVKDLTPDQIRAADEWIDKHFSFIVPNEDDLITLEYTLEKAAAAIRRYDAKLVVIDPWNEMDHARPQGMTLTEYTGFAIKEFKRLANRHDIHLIVAAHPSKPMKEPGGKVRVPGLYDISDSAHWYNKADVGIVVHRNDEKTTLVRVAKSRYHDQIGTPGDIECGFNPYTNRYFPIAMETSRSVRNTTGDRDED